MAFAQCLNNKAKVTLRKAYGYRTYRIAELSLYHVLGRLPEPKPAHRFFRRSKMSYCGVVLSRDSESAPVLRPIARRYLLVLTIPVYLDADGSRWVDHLWYKDLVEHVEYLANFTFACPCITGPRPATAVRVDDSRITFADLPGRHKLTLNLPRTVIRLWRLVGQAEVVHTGLGGWLPISIQNMTGVMAKLRRRFLFIVVESSPWRLLPGARHSWTERVAAALSEWTNRRMIDQVDLALFTQAEYMASLMRRNRARGHVVHASWIDSANIATRQQALEDWESKLKNLGHLKVLFAGRVTAAKGILVLLDALKLLDAKGREVEVHVMGTGDLLSICQRFEGSLRTTKMKLLDPVSYGTSFYTVLRSYHAVLVPSVTDEQPRIVYDAYSQGVPVLASDTPGLRDCVHNGVTGHLFRPNDAAALADAIEWCSTNLHALGAMSGQCLDNAHALTHKEMHRRRWVLLDKALRA